MNPPAITHQITAPTTRITCCGCWAENWQSYLYVQYRIDTQNRHQHIHQTMEVGKRGRGDPTWHYPAAPASVFEGKKKKMARHYVGRLRPSLRLGLWPLAFGHWPVINWAVAQLNCQYPTVECHIAPINRRIPLPLYTYTLLASTHDSSCTVSYPVSAQKSESESGSGSRSRSISISRSVQPSTLEP